MGTACALPIQGYSRVMKFWLAMVVHALMAVLLSLGLLKTVHGDPWLLVFGVVFYTLMLATLGCLPKKAH